VHGLLGQRDSHAPGLTSLTGLYRRPAPLYVCYSRGDLHLTHVTDYDATDAFSFCVPASTVELGAKLAYYAAKLIQVARSLPAPPPP
jgi:hypothetical protein